MRRPEDGGSPTTLSTSTSSHRSPVTVSVMLRRECRVSRAFDKKMLSGGARHTNHPRAREYPPIPHRRHADSRIRDRPPDSAHRDHPYSAHAHKSSSYASPYDREVPAQCECLSRIQANASQTSAETNGTSHAW